VVSALSIAIYIDAASLADAQLGIGLLMFPIVQGAIGVVLLGVLAVFKATVERRASNSALLTDTYSSPLRAQGGAAKRER
jgi:hypothetical protein